MKRNITGRFMAIVFLVSLALISGAAYSAPTVSQMIENVRLTSIAQYTLGGYHVIEVYFDPETPISTGCAPTDQLNMVNYWVGSDIATIYATRVSHWLAALSTGSRVDIILEGNTCDTSATHPNIGGPNGLGRRMMSMRVYAD